MASSTMAAGQLSQTLIDFASNGEFPDESISASVIENEALPAAVEALNQAKLSLETEIRQISGESADVDTWIKHAEALQHDIDKSRKLANEIVQQAEADEARVTDVQNHKNHVELLVKEIEFNAQLMERLQSMKRANDFLDKAAEEAEKHEIHEALHSLDVAGNQISEIPADRTVRAMRLLDTRYYGLKSSINEQLNAIRKSLICVQPGEASMTIHKELSGISTTLENVAVGLARFKELDTFGKDLWEKLNEAIVQHRTGLESTSLFKICIENNTLRVTEEEADSTIKSLFEDIIDIIRFLDQNLPKSMVESLSAAMMPDLSKIIIGTWLESSVPTSLSDMVAYQKALAQAGEFADTLESLNWPGAEEFHDWVAGASKIWLTKKRETSLDQIRNALAIAMPGVGLPQEAKRVEMRMVTKDDSMHVTSSGETVKDDWGWGDAEDEEEEETHPVMRNRASLDEERSASTISISPLREEDLQPDEEDAWGWGDDDNIAVDSPFDDSPPQISVIPKSPANTNNSTEKRNVTLSEKYWTSSMPITIFNHIVTIYEDGSKLMQPDHEFIPVSPAAVGLSNIPTLILAMYRAVSPCYYADDPKGNMFSYNDAMWLVDKLKSFSTKWHSRTDLPPRAFNLVKIDSEIGPLESFGKRAYKNEMDTQRAILNDLLGGMCSQNFVYNDSENAIRSAISHINQQSASWKQILPYSTWASAVGTLANTVATRIINDVFELTDLGVDAAERIALLIQQVNDLDSLFKANEIGTYANNWLKMQFLSEVLQSNLKDIRFLWFESHLSLYFSKDEVKDLIELSFEDNANSRSLIKDIKEKPMPDVGSM
ncbi:ribosome biogenesis protein ytm1 [Ciborinia camelliae]|nr:ribosome biogenesis protein ytm1 [Ciborinia camelliae]